MRKISSIYLVIFTILFIFQIAYADQVDSLIKSLGDENEEVRQSAENALIHIGKPAEEALIKALRNRNSLIRRHAGYALAQMGNPQAIESLVETMKEGGGRHEVEEAAKLIARMRCKEAIPVLIDMLQNAAKEIQKQGEKGLILIGEPAVEPLLKLLKHKEARIRIAAINILGDIGDKRAIEPLIKSIEEDTEARTYAVTALGKMNDTSTVPLLIELLEDEDPLMRKMTADALGTIGDERAVKPLISLLNDEDPSVPGYAINGLSRLGEKAFESLIALLKDENPKVRKYAIITLGRIKNEKTLPSLLSVIKDRDEYIDVREAAVTAYGSIGGEKVIDELVLILQSDEVHLSQCAAKELAKLDTYAVKPLIGLLGNKNPTTVENAKEALRIIGSSALPLLVETLNHKDPNVRVSAIEVLSDIDDKSVVPDIVKKLNDRNKSIQIATIKALGRLGDERAVQPLIKNIGAKDRDIKLNVIASLSLIGERVGEKAVKELLNVIKEERGEIQREAVATLGKIKSKKAAGELIELLDTKDLALKRAVITALGDIGDERAAEPLINILSHENSDIRRLTVLALGEIGSKAAVNALVALLKDPAKNVRLATVMVLSSNAEKLEENAINTLIEALREPDEHQQRLIAYALSSMGEIVIDPLINVLEDERPDIRKYAARALGPIRSPQAVEPLIEALRDEDGGVRAAAAAALGEIGDDKAVDPLIKHLTDEYREVKMAAIWALGNIGDPRAAMPLNIALSNNDPLVQAAASNAMGRLTGQSCPLVTSLTRYDAVSYTWAIILGLLLVFSFVVKKIKPIAKFFQKTFSKLKLPVKVKWWFMLVLGIGALALFIWCYVCKYGEGAAAFALQKPGFLPTLYLYSFRVFPFFIGGCILSGFILRYFSGRWRLPSSLLGSTTLGAVTPLCSCAAIPMARGMLAAQIPVRAVIAFLIATPVLSPFIIFMSYGIIGLEFTLVRIVSVFILAIAAGLFIEKVVGREEVERDSDFQNLCRGCARAGTAHGPTDSALITAWNQVGYLLKYMLLGVFLGALLEEYLPVSIVAKYLNSSFFGLFVATTVGLPLYLCSGQEVLLLKPLMDMGLPLGHAIAFTISANGICLTSIALLVGAIGKKTTLWITILFWVGSLVLGYLINLFL